VVEPSHPSSERSSLSMMISEMRQKTRTESTFDESDNDRRGRNQLGTAKASSSSTSSSAGERIILDFPFDDVKGENKRNEVLPKAFPGLQIRQKSIHDIRELRSSIDNSLIKPPTPQRHHLRRTSTASIKANSELHDESEDEKPRITPKLNITKAKSPFRRTVESGSDLDSIDFEEIGSLESFMEANELTRSSTSSPRSSGSRKVTSTSSQSNSSSASHSSNIGSSSTSSRPSSSEITSSASPTVRNDVNASSRTPTVTESEQLSSKSAKTQKTERSSGEAVQQKSTSPKGGTKEQNSDSFSASFESESGAPDIQPPIRRERISQEPQRQSNRRSSPLSRRLSESSEPLQASSLTPVRRSAKPTEMKPKTSSKHISSSFPFQKTSLQPKNFSDQSTQTEFRRLQQFPEFCSANVHYVMKDVLRTHLHLLREYSRLEWTTLQEWNAVLDDIRKNYDGPTTKKLQAIVEKYNRKYDEP
ncbi:hypothetical protein Angca_005233, partial [Angiostrongylus cantonensis]